MTSLSLCMVFSTPTSASVVTVTTHKVDQTNVLHHAEATVYRFVAVHTQSASTQVS